MTPDAAATILAAAVGGVFGLLGVAIGFFLGRIARESDRRNEALVAIYQNIEFMQTLLVAYQKQMVPKSTVYEKWNQTTEKVLVVLLRSGLDLKAKKKVFRAINLKWEDPKSVTELAALADELLIKIDPEYAQAAKELLKDLGVKREDIDPIILTKKD